MKKFIIAILAVLYIGTSTGATLHMHYCMGKLAAWDFGHNKSNTCGKCGMEKGEKKDNGCCKDEQKFLKNNTDQKTAESVFQLVQLMVVNLPASFAETALNNIPFITEKKPASHTPFRSSGATVYIRNCVFLI